MKPKHDSPGVPHRVGLHRWGQVIIQSLRDLRASNALEWSAALSFYFLLSLFPLLLFGVVLASYIVDPAWVTARATELLGQFLPAGQVEIEKIVTAAADDRRQAGVVSLVLLLFTGRRVLGAVTKGLNLVSDVDEQEDPLQRRAVVEIVLLFGIACLVLLALTSRPLLTAAWQTLRMVPGPDHLLLQVVRGIVHVFLLVAIFTLVYAFVPRGARQWRAVFAGATTATVLFLIAQGIYGALLDLLWANANLVYGPLAIAALLLSWGWYVALITLTGGALASHTKVMILENGSRHQAERTHVGGSPAT